jgi:hypothetical protein
VAVAWAWLQEKPPQLETASPSIVVSALLLCAKIATTPEVRGRISRKIRTRRSVVPRARRARERIGGRGGRVWRGRGVTVGQAIAQPASQETPQNASAEAPSESTSPPAPIPGVRRWVSHARRSATVLIGRIPGAWWDAALLSRPAPASEQPPEAQADRNEDAYDPEEVAVDLGDARQELLRCGQRWAHPCAWLAEIGLQGVAISSFRKI